MADARFDALQDRSNRDRNWNRATAFIGIGARYAKRVYGLL